MVGRLDPLDFHLSFYIFVTDTSRVLERIPVTFEHSRHGGRSSGILAG
jgi:hypothetical protein